MVVGYFNKEKTELATSTNRIARVTNKGVITEKGTFYPFKKAHLLYLDFLINIEKENTVIAINWEYTTTLSS